MPTTDVRLDFSIVKFTNGAEVQEPKDPEVVLYDQKISESHKFTAETPTAWFKFACDKRLADKQ